MQTVMIAEKPRKQAISGRFWAGRTYWGRIKDDHKIDPCCGSGGFFLATQEYLTDPANYPSLTREQKQFIKNDTFYGTELVPVTYKLCLMNLYLHNIGDIYGRMPVARGDALLSDPGYRTSLVMTNPPFGKKSSLTFTNEEGGTEEEDLVYNRQDFWTTGSNKQLNFLQHINTLLKTDGRAAVVLPDNVLFEGGAGETVRKKLLETCELHTILRLPTGIFYKPGVKANVLFFDRKPRKPCRERRLSFWEKSVSFCPDNIILIIFGAF